MTLTLMLLLLLQAMDLVLLITMMDSKLILMDKMNYSSNKSRIKIEIVIRRCSFHPYYWWSKQVVHSYDDSNRFQHDTL